MNETSVSRMMATPRWVKVTGWVVLGIFLFLVVLGIYWSRMPKMFWVNEFVEDNRHVVGFSTTDPASDEREECLHVIRRRGELETFEAAKIWCGSHETADRKLAADLLYCLGKLKQVGEVELYPFTPQSIPLLRRITSISCSRGCFPSLVWT